MTRILGPEMVPAGFTITTGACALLHPTVDPDAGVEVLARGVAAAQAAVA
jgi:hypothetical protein